MTVGETRDGPGAGDHDEPYDWDERPHSLAPAPFTILAFSRLLVLRSKIAEGLIGGGDMHSDPLVPMVVVPQAEDPSTYSPSD